MAKKEKRLSLERRLKEFSVVQIEDALTKAIVDLVGDSCHVNIKSLDFKSDDIRFMGDGYDIHLSISEFVNDDDDIPF